MQIRRPCVESESRTGQRGCHPAPLRLVCQSSLFALRSPLYLCMSLLPFSRSLYFASSVLDGNNAAVKVPPTASNSTYAQQSQADMCCRGYMLLGLGAHAHTHSRVHRRVYQVNPPEIHFSVLAAFPANCCVGTRGPGPACHPDPPPAGKIHDDRFFRLHDATILRTHCLARA